MKKIIKKILMMVLVVAVTLSNFLPFVPMLEVKADPAWESNHTITFKLDNGTANGNEITFTDGNNNVTAVVSGAEYTFGATNDNPPIPTLSVNYGNVGNLKITFNNRDGVSVNINGNPININGDNEIVLNDYNYSDDAPHLQVSISSNEQYQPGEGDNTQNHQGNAEATLNYKVSGDIEYDDEMGTGVGFQINGVTYKMTDQAVFTYGTTCDRDENGQCLKDENGNDIPLKDPDTLEPMNKKMSVTITDDTIRYDKDLSDKVSFKFVTSWNTKITSIKINNSSVENLPTTREQFIIHYNNQAMEITVNDIPNANLFDIEVTAEKMSQNELYMGNFLWDYNPEGYTRPDDKILNAKLTLVEAEYDGHVYTTEEEINTLGGLYNWDDAERKKTYSSDREGVGSATFPTGTKLTVKIIPDAGYQLVDFGLNGSEFEPQEEIGTYTFEIQGGNFHLQARIAQVDDVVKTTAEKIKSGNITLGGTENSMSVGSARLDVSDINLTQEQINNFEEAASGYSINNYIDISLFNTVFKGSETQSWDTEVKDLDNEATITLKLEDGVDGNEVVIVHEKHDGTYEIIPVVYNAETNTITFKTKSFSNYAIATKTNTSNDANVTITKSSNPKTFDGILIWISLFTVSLVGLTIGTYKFKKITSK